MADLDDFMEVSTENYAKADVLTEQELSDMMGWALGKGENIPSSVTRMTSNLQNKLAFATCYTLLVNMQRNNNLLNFVVKAEQELYNPAVISSKTIDEISNLHKEATKTLLNNMEFTRKYMSQNKELLTPKNESADKVKDMLASLPADKLETLLDMLQRGDI